MFSKLKDWFKKDRGLYSWRELGDYVYMLYSNQGYSPSIFRIIDMLYLIQLFYYVKHGKKLLKQEIYFNDRLAIFEILKSAGKKRTVWYGSLLSVNYKYNCLSVYDSVHPIDEDIRTFICSVFEKHYENEYYLYNGESILSLSYIDVMNDYKINWKLVAEKARTIM